MKMTTIEEDAKRYVDCLHGPLNGWGQTMIDDVPSHIFRWHMYNHYGQDAVDAKIKDIFETIGGDAELTREKEAADV